MKTLALFCLLTLPALAVEQQPSGDTSRPGLIGRLKDIEPLYTPDEKQSGENHFQPKTLQSPVFKISDPKINKSKLSKTSFYGIDGYGSRFVFVCDISGSMMGPKFTRLMQELRKAISKLPSNAKFYIIFFGDTHFPLFCPNTVHQMVPATAANKMKVQNWLSKVAISGGTYAFNAIKMAFKMEPDTMFLLSDGVFSDHLEVANAFDSIRGQKSTRVHTVSIGQPSNFLRRIAEFNNGTYQEILQ